MKRWQLATSVFVATLSILGLVVGAASAQYTSPNYQVNQAFFGSGGSLQMNSSNYQANGALGELGVGNSKSSNYQAQVGYNTDRTPYLQFIVNGANIDLGVLTSATTSVATATFSVKDYLSSGYVVQTDSPPPTYSGHSLNALTTPTASSTGSEQFGMNLVANSCPANTPASGAGSCSGSLGANPSQQPDSTFSFGTVDPSVCSKVTSGYDTPDEYKYVNGDIIAASCQSSGETDYTVSYIFNISNTTPAGAYTFHHVLIATATY